MIIADGPFFCLLKKTEVIGRKLCLPEYNTFGNKKEKRPIQYFFHKSRPYKPQPFTAITLKRSKKTDTLNRNHLLASQPRPSPFNAVRVWYVWACADVSEAAVTPGHALEVCVRRKLSANLPSCRAAGVECMSSWLILYTLRNLRNTCFVILPSLSGVGMPPCGFVGVLSHYYLTDFLKFL